MHVVTVLFETKPEFADQFKTAVMAQAENSIAREERCKRFDVCRDPDNPSRFFLYEFYEDKAAFELHLKTEHYLNFDAKTADWVSLKKPQAWSLLEV